MHASSSLSPVKSWSLRGALRFLSVAYIYYPGINAETNLQLSSPLNFPYLQEATLCYCLVNSVFTLNLVNLAHHGRGSKLVGL